MTRRQIEQTVKKNLLPIRYQLMEQLLIFCERQPSKENIKYINNDMFWTYTAQLYRTTVDMGDIPYLNEEQIKIIQKFVDNKWNGSDKHFGELFNLQIARNKDKN